jgi:hypothetical protein
MAGVHPYANDASVLQLMDLPEIQVDRDAALLPGPGLVHERHDSVITGIDLALDLKRPVVELPRVAPELSARGETRLARVRVGNPRRGRGG